MNRVFVFLAALAVLTTASCSSSSRPENPVLSVEGGQIQGVVLDSSDVIVYRGIPYAAPPVGDLRWKRPQPVVAWDGVKVADTFGPAAMQRAHRADDGHYGTEFFEQDAPFSEDCLYLNVWTPAEAAGNPLAKLPVAIWVHGGGYSGGWGYEPEMDGVAWARKGVILVTINYRLGVMGFFNHTELSAENCEGISGNYGFYDQAASVVWVKNNIAAFGGNPADITLLGQSAGGTSIKTLCVSPITRDLISKAIIQSAGGMRPGQVNYTQEELDAMGKRVMDEAGLSTLEQLRAADYATLNAIVAAQRGPGKKPFDMGVHVDGVGLTEMFEAGAQDGTIADIPYLTGTMKDDIGDVDRMEGFEPLREAVSRKPVFRYYFQHDLPNDGRPCIQGAFHSGELWYEFGTLPRSWRPFTEADYALSEQVIDWWTNFAKYGDPNGPDSGSWKPSTSAEPYVQIIDIEE